MNKSPILLRSIALIWCLVFLFTSCKNKVEAYNVVFILADDQGYGDFGFTGNPYIKTPNLDELSKESVLFTNFHTETTCSPTRAGLMTGHYANKTGVWHTINGREFLSKDFKTIAQYFQEAGYETGIFGKWHLGESKGYRPEEQGFKEAFTCAGGGVSQIADFWNNDYFGDTYYRNGKPEKVEDNAFCTDVWFENAYNFIEKATRNKKPFFCYIPANAAHSPHYAPEKYLNLYLNDSLASNAAFNGMLSHLDHAVGKLRAQLEKLGISKNTIIVFTSDNGSSFAAYERNGKKVGYDAGYSGKKGSELEGGHRLPLMIYSPNSKTDPFRSNELTSYIDIMPTLLDLYGIEIPSEIDGISLKASVMGTHKINEDRIIVSNTQREDFLVKLKNTSVMQGDWRLVSKSKAKIALFDLSNDPAQKNDVSDKYPKKVNELKAGYEAYWQKTSVNRDKYNLITIDGETLLTADDTHENRGNVAWLQSHVRNGLGASHGFWTIDVPTTQFYSISLRRYPKESGLALGDESPQGDSVPGTDPPLLIGLKMDIIEALLLINKVETDRKKSINSSKEIEFTATLQKGMNELSCQFILADGTPMDAYFVYVKPI